MMEIAIIICLLVLIGLKMYEIILLSRWVTMQRGQSRDNVARHLPPVDKLRGLAIDDGKINGEPPKTGLFLRVGVK